MNVEEFRELVAKNDKLNGNLVKTLPYIKRRERRINNFCHIDKFMVLLEHIIKSGVRFMLFENTQNNYKTALFTDIFIPKYRICVRYESGTDKSRKKSEIFYAIKRGPFYPLFIRENETIEFILEKYDNTVKNALSNPKSKNLNLPCTKKPRNRIKPSNYVKVN